MLKFFGKFNKFQPLITKKFAFSKITNFTFATINLRTKDGTIDRSENESFNQNINWELSKIWISPQYNSYLNKIEPNKNYNSDETEQCKLYQVGSQIQIFEFERFLRKVGLTISRQNNVYILDGLLDGKKVRIVSSDTNDAANCASLFEEQGKFLIPEIHILYLTDASSMGEKKFVFYDKKTKTIVANTKNMLNITKAIELLDVKEEVKK